MKEFLAVLQKSKLFSGLTDEQMLTALKCLSGAAAEYVKNDVILFDGSAVDFIGVIISGEVQTQKTDYDGNANIVSKQYPADVIAASACYSTVKQMPFDVVALSDCKILRLNAGNIIRPCSNACAFHLRLMQNMINIIADRNVAFASKIDILTRRTIREKVLTFLYAQSKRAKNKRFSIPFSRRQMAEYLSINRSALSRELCNLRDEGVLEFDSNSFLLKQL